MPEKTVSIADARKYFSSIIGEVAYGKRRVLITKRGKPMAWPTPAVLEKSHLAEAKGWLENNDPFFKTIENTVRANTLPG